MTVADELGNGVARGRRSSRVGQVGEQDPPVVVDAALQRHGAEVARHVPGLEPVGELGGVADRGREGDDLELRVAAGGAG